MVIGKLADVGEIFDGVFYAEYVAAIILIERGANDALQTGGVSRPELSQLVELLPVYPERSGLFESLNHEGGCPQCEKVADQLGPYPHTNWTETLNLFAKGIV